MWPSILTGIGSSLVASVVFALFVLLIKARGQRKRASRFTGTYRMLERDGSPTGGTVRIERIDWWEDLRSSAPYIAAFAEHGKGTEDWRAVAEVRGHSSTTATGYYEYPNREGGSLRFVLKNGGNEIAEYGTPFDSKSSPFIKRLKRVQKSAPVTSA
jgi:hypothetical protein